MIEASFDRMSRAAAISGVYQYDTGQRLRLHGLPSPDELTGEDDLLSGELPTVQVHYSYVGDSNAEVMLAQWDEWRGVWIADIPDAYMTRREAVYVHVYVYYGEARPEVMFLNTETEVRGCTMYEGVFTPISRPAPGGAVTDEQAEAWAAYETEIDLALTSAQTATTNAKQAARAANEAAQAAGEAAQDAQDAAQAAQSAKDALTIAGERLAHAQHSVIDLRPGSEATAVYYRNTLTFGIPQGEKGETGDAGADGPTDITLAFSSGALTITPKEG